MKIKKKISGANFKRKMKIFKNFEDEDPFWIKRMKKTQNEMKIRSHMNSNNIIEDYRLLSCFRC